MIKTRIRQQGKLIFVMYSYGQRGKKSTQITVSPEQLNEEGTIINHPEAAKLNRRIQRIITTITSTYNDLAVLYTVVPKSLFEQKLEEKLNLKPSNKIKSRYILKINEYIKKNKNKKSAKTISMMEMIKKGLEAYRTPEAFLNSLLNKGRDNKTVNTYAILMHNAFNFEYERLRVTENDPVYLTNNELTRFESLLFTHPSIDAFLLSCYTGLRQSDIRLLQLSHIKDDVIKINMFKTGVTISVPITSKAMVILNHYSKPGLLFNLPSVQNVWEMLKRKAKELGINSEVIRVSYSGSKRIEEVKQKWELISMHSGRKTFATRLYHKGVDIITIQKVLGHKDLKTTQKYVGWNSSKGFSDIIRVLE